MNAQFRFPCLDFQFMMRDVETILKQKFDQTLHCRLSPESPPFQLSFLELDDEEATHLDVIQLFRGFFEYHDWAALGVWFPSEDDEEGNAKKCYSLWLCTNERSRVTAFQIASAVVSVEQIDHSKPHSVHFFLPLHQPPPSIFSSLKLPWGEASIFGCQCAVRYSFNWRAKHPDYVPPIIDLPPLGFD